MYLKYVSYNTSFLTKSLFVCLKNKIKKNSIKQFILLHIILIINDLL